MPTPIETNTATMQALLEKLAGKAAGGGSGAVETCTVTVNPSEYAGCSVAYYDENGTIYAQRFFELASFDCQKNGMLVYKNNTNLEFTVEGGEFIGSFLNTFSVFKVTSDMTINTVI